MNNVFRRVEKKLAKRFEKDAADEGFLTSFNAILKPHQDQHYEDLQERFPTLHIVGAPRSGTTLALQLAISHLNIGYINNLIAAFWQAPTYGIRLSKKLLPLNRTSTYSSEYGRTKEIWEPHEFGYFWSELLGYEEMLEADDTAGKRVDWDRVKKAITNMTFAYEHPIVFKSFLLGWHMEQMQRILPKTCFVRVRRDPLQNALSILELRQEFLGSREEWASMKPKEYRWLKDEPVWKQVAGQVYYLEKAMNEQIDRLKGRNVLDIDYEEICNDPAEVLNRVKDLLNRNGADIQITSAPPKSFTVEILDDSDRARVEESINEFYQM